MEIKKQANCTYPTPEQVKANLVRAKHNWYLNKDYGGHGYECLTQVLTCSCGREAKAIKLRRHERTKLHKRCLQATQAVEYIIWSNLTT